MEKISIIIPVYNVQDYLERCLDSILNQTYTEFEVICVDDGSSDLSGEICERYGEMDSRIHTYHIPNEGVGNARNHGLSLIRGEWFAYVDADDWLEPDYLEILYTNAVNNQCEISACCYENDNRCRKRTGDTEQTVSIFSGKKECIHAFICPEESLYGMVWNKLYRTEKFRDIMFRTDLRFNEDCIYTQCIMERCKRVCRTDLKLYHWYFREGSACHTKRMQCDLDSADVFRELLDKNSELTDAEINRRLQKNYVLLIMKYLMYSEYSRQDERMLRAIKRCKEWKRNIWKQLNGKEKAKYCLVFYTPWLTNTIVNMMEMRK